MLDSDGIPMSFIPSIPAHCSTACYRACTSASCDGSLALLPHGLGRANRVRDNDSRIQTNRTALVSGTVRIRAQGRSHPRGNVISCTRALSTNLRRAVLDCSRRSEHRGAESTAHSVCIDGFNLDFQAASTPSGKTSEVHILLLV